MLKPVACASTAVRSKTAQLAVSVQLPALSYRATRPDDPAPLANGAK